jgi:hypothetical protein
VKISTVRAHYSTHTEWNIRGDLETAHWYAIKWDTLTVCWKEGEVMEYEPLPRRP